LLLDSGYLPKKIIVACRLHSIEIKTILDEELLETRKPAWPANACKLKNAAEILYFMKKAEGIHSARGVDSTFFAWLLDLTFNFS